MPKKLPDFEVQPILEWLGAADAPHVLHGHRKMLCPFHDDSSPSASVSRYGFRCFTCSVTGDAISLLRTQGGLDFASAVQRAQELTGSTGGDVSPTGGWAGSLLD